MAAFHATLTLLIVVTLVGIAGRRLPVPLPFLLVGAGLALGVAPWFPRIALDPGLFFALFLPPLLYADGWMTNLREFRAALRPILLLSIGLVVFTTVVVGYAVHALIPGVPLAVALALGAIVSPTDAVAVAEITGRIRLPLRIPAVLNGESLVNDASGLVAFKMALAAAAAATAFSPGAAALELARVSAGGVAIGLAVGWLSASVRTRLERFGDSDTLLEVTLSLLTPFAAYLPADQLGFSGVLAVVAAGLHNGWADPIRLSAATRQAAWTVWSIVLFLLNGLVFLLLGLQLPRIFESLADEWWAVLILYAVIVSTLVVALRLVWVFPGAYLPRWLSRRIREREPEPGWRAVFVVAWSGLRGAVTLAAALSIPFVLPSGEPFPARALIIFLAASVILVTLLLQGSTLPWLIRRLGVVDDGSQVEEERAARLALARSALEHLRTAARSESACDQESAAKLAVELEERIAELAGEQGRATPVAERRRRERAVRADVLAGQRATVIELYRAGRINDDLLRRLQAELDLEEARVARL